MRVRVPARVSATYLDGSQAWYSPEEEAHDLFHRIADTPARKDGSRLVEMTDDERELMLNYAEAWEAGCRDNAGPDDMDALSDLRAMQSLIGYLTAKEAMVAWVHDDGGRSAAGYRGSAGDCVVRAIAIAGGRGYSEVYEELRERIKAHRWGRREKPVKSPRDGVPKSIIRRYLAETGWDWTPTMRVGQGTTVHLRREELPTGRLIVQCSRHLTAVIDGTIHDTHDPSRDGTRAVYGYWKSASTG
jgi:hypothetical protein